MYQISFFLHTTNSVSINVPNFFFFLHTTNSVSVDVSAFFCTQQTLYQSMPQNTSLCTGRRVGLGESMAKAELFLFISHIFQRFTVAPESPDRLPSSDSVLGLTQALVPHRIRFVKRNAFSRYGSKINDRNNPNVNYEQKLHT